MSKDIRVQFPLGGIHEGGAFTDQPPSTTSDALNVTGQDPVSGRGRGAQRAGMSKFNTNSVGNNKIALISNISYDAAPASITAYASGSENTSWAKTLPGKGSVWCMTTDPSNNVYVVDTGSTIVKYNPTGYQLYTHKVQVKDDAHEIRAITIDQGGIIYVGVSAGGDQNTAHIFAFEEIEGTSGQYLNKIWEYKTERYVNKLVYASGKLYVGMNNVSASESAIAVLSNVGTAVPQLEREIRATYPLGDIAVSPKDGGIVATSPINTARGGDRLINTTFKSPRSVDWDPSKLEGFDRRIWAWLDASDIDGDGTNNETYTDGEEIQVWTDKSGNGRDLFIEPLAGYFGPLLSKQGFNGLDCLSFSGVDQSGIATTKQYLRSEVNTQILGIDTATAASNPENLALIPTHAGASYAMFIVFEALEDGTRPQHVFSQRFAGYTQGTSGTSDFTGITSISAHHAAIGTGSITSSLTTASATAGYSPGSCTLLGFGEHPTLGATELAGVEATNSYDKMQLQIGPAAGNQTAHSGTGKKNRFIVSYIHRGMVAGAIRLEPLETGEAAAKVAGFNTTDASHFRVNGKLCQTFKGLHLYSGEKSWIGALAPTIDTTYSSATSSFKGRICEIIVLKEWYYRPDEVAAPVRLNVCSSRPPAYTTADHGEYKSTDYLQEGGDSAFVTTGFAAESRLSSKIYETELIEGYLAHKWGIADELPNELVGYIAVRGNATILDGSTLSIPTAGGAVKTYTFKTSSATSGADWIFVPAGGVTATQLRAQAFEIYRTINGNNATFANLPSDHFYAMPPTFSALDSTTAGDRYAVIEIRVRSSMAHALTATGFNAQFATSSAAISFFGYSTSYTNAVAHSRLVPRTKINPSDTLGLGINYSVHPFAEHRRQIHENSSTPASWSILAYYVARTLGGPPRADGKRKYQPAQIFSSSSQNLVKYDTDTGNVKWSLYNGSPEGVLSGNDYTGYGGFGFGLAINTDGVIFSSGQRSTQQTYPSYTEHTRRGRFYPSSVYDVRATNDLGASTSLSWEKQVSADTGLDDSPGWSRPVVDEKKNLVLPVADQESTLAALVVYKASDGTELHRHVLNAASDQYQIGLSSAASTGTINLPSSFVNPRSEYVYLGTREDNTAIITFTVQPSAGQTITLSDGSDIRTYTFAAAASAANEVTIGGSLAVTIANLRAAINKTSGGYGASTTINASIVARHNTADKLYLAARSPEPSGGTGVFTFSTTTTATMSAVQYRDACIRRINLLNATPTGSVASFRSAKNVAVDGDGAIYTFASTGGPAAAGGISFTSTDAQYYDSAVLYQKLYITNGFEVLVYDPVENTVSKLESKASGSPTERWALIASWRGRLVLGRSLTSPHNWIMSAIGDPTNWDLFPPVVNPGQAVSGTVSRAGLVPDVVNALIPYSDDLMLIGGDHSIYRMTGDPMSGGQIDLVTDVTGIAFGRAWDKDPQGILYFMSSRGALFAWPPGRQIKELSLGKFEQRLARINFAKSYTQLVWNDLDRTLHIFTMPFGKSAAGVTALHYRYERDTGAFWEDRYGPSITAACVVDGDASDDRKLLLGSTDNYIRQWDNNAASDDGVAIDSYVTFGPFGSQETELRLSMIQAVLADNQQGVNVQLFAGDTPDVLGDPVWAGQLTSGRNPNMFVRARGSYFWIRLRNSAVGERWAFENMMVRVADAGRKRVR
jgi:hypothetical protein